MGNMYISDILEGKLNKIRSFFLNKNVKIYPSTVLSAIFHANDKKTLDENAKHYLADPQYVAACRDFLVKISPDVRTIEDTRRHIVEFLNQIK